MKSANIYGVQKHAVYQTAKHNEQIVEAFRQHGCQVEIKGEGNWLRITKPSGLGLQSTLTAWVKLHSKPSRYGLNRRRILKLEIRAGKVSLYNYDRGLDFENLYLHPEGQSFFKLIVNVIEMPAVMHNQVLP